MPRARNPYPPEFREQIVALARAGRSVEDLAASSNPARRRFTAGSSRPIVTVVAGPTV